MAFNDFILSSYYGGFNQAQANAPLNPYSQVGGSKTMQMMQMGVQEMDSENDPVAKTQESVAVGNTGSPAITWVIFAVAIVVLMIIVEKSGLGKNIGDIGFSIYNILVITFVALLSSGFLKVLAAKFPIPGVSSLIIAS